MNGFKRAAQIARLLALLFVAIWATSLFLMAIGYSLDAFVRWAK